MQPYLVDIPERKIIGIGNTLVNRPILVMFGQLCSPEYTKSQVG
jgi:hypothetical protein